MFLPNNIRYLRKTHGMSQDDLALKLGKKSYTTIQKWESGVSEPPLKIVHAIAEIFHVDIDELTNTDLSTPYSNPNSTKIPTGFRPLPRMVKKPLVGSIACGEPITAEENIEDYVDVPEHVKCDFCLMCKGDSMIDANIHDGDIVYIRADVDVPNGQIAAVRIGEEATLKRIYLDRENGSLTLVPANSQYAPMTFTGAALADVHIEGKAVGFTHLL